MAIEKVLEMDVSRVFEANWFATTRWVINRGGTRSTKTISLCQQSLNWLMFGQFRDDLILMEGDLAIVRKEAETIRKTVMKDFDDLITFYGLWGFIDRNKQAKEYRVAGRLVKMVGADDEQKMRGFKADITWMNEGNELEWGKSIKQLRFRTTKVLVIDFNPTYSSLWIKEKLEIERQERKGDVTVIVSTYRDNRWLSKEQVEEILEEANENYGSYMVYVLGEYGTAEQGDYYWGFSNKIVGDYGWDVELAKNVLHTSFDQNVVPYNTGLCALVYWDEEMLEWVLRIFDVIKLEPPNNGSEQVAERILGKYEGDGLERIFVYGDASGKKRNTVGENDYKIIKAVFSKYIDGGSDRVMKANPRHKVRSKFLNRLMQGKVRGYRVEIDKSCLVLIADFIELNQDKNGGKHKPVKRDREKGISYEKLGHASDAFDYFCISLLRDEFLTFSKNLK